jgi:hypothetical protein
MNAANKKTAAATLISMTLNCLRLSRRHIATRFATELPDRRQLRHRLFVASSPQRYGENLPLPESLIRASREVLGVRERGLFQTCSQVNPCAVARCS